MDDGSRAVTMNYFWRDIVASPNATGIIDIQVRESGKDNVEIIVADKGCGMSLDVRRRAFY